jgi:hypothetical protein
MSQPQIRAIGPSLSCCNQSVCRVRRSDRFSWKKNLVRDCHHFASSNFSHRIIATFPTGSHTVTALASCASNTKTTSRVFGPSVDERLPVPPPVQEVAQPEPTHRNLRWSSHTKIVYQIYPSSEVLTMRNQGMQPLVRILMAPSLPIVIPLETS